MVIVAILKVVAVVIILSLVGLLIPYVEDS